MLRRNKVLLYRLIGLHLISLLVYVSSDYFLTLVVSVTHNWLYNNLVSIE